MDNTAFAGVIMGDTIVLVCYSFARPVSRRRDSRLAFTPAYDFDTQMIDCDISALLTVIFE